MALYQWGFKIDTLPAPPAGYNKSAPPPNPEIVGKSNLRILDANAPDKFEKWLKKNDLEPGSQRIGHIDGKKEVLDYRKLILLCIAYRNIDVFPWPKIIKGFDLTDPPTVSVGLTATAVWKQLFTENNQGGEADTEAYEIKTGVTTTDSETKTFSEKIGAGVNGGYGPISGSLSAEFSRTSSHTHSISVSKERTVRHSFLIPENSFVQGWQLVIRFRIKDGPAIEHATRQFQKLTYPNSDDPFAQKYNEDTLAAMLKSPSTIIL